MNYTQNKLEESVQSFNEPLKLEIGSLYQAKAIKKIPNAQDGGVVTSLLGYALDDDIIKGAVVAGRDIYWNTFPAIVTDSRELKKYAGSVYFPMNNRDYKEMVRRAIDTYRDIGIVITPNELKVLGIGISMINSDEIYLKIGLFCLGIFNPEKFWNYVDKGIKREDVKRFEIDKELKLIDKEGKTIFQRPVKEAHEYSIPRCKKCRDFIPDAADLSVGAGPEKNTCGVYIQTARGLEIFKKAYKNDLLVVEEVPAKFNDRFKKTVHQKSLMPRRAEPTEHMACI
jgi:coenzyme F420 hydrogenase subunit beta